MRAAVLFVTLLPLAAEAQWVQMKRHDGKLKADLSNNSIAGDTGVVLVGDGGDEIAGPAYGNLTNLYLQGGDLGWGAYLALPIFASVDPGTFKIGNLEVGALLDVDLALMYLTLHVGVAIPTLGSDELTRSAGYAAAFGRPGDQVHFLPETVSPRFGGSLRIPAGVLFLRADVGVDLAIPISGGDLNTWFGAGVGLGAKWLLFGATFEWAFSGVITSGQSSGFVDEIHSLAFSLRLHTPYLQPYVGGQLPLGLAEAQGQPWSLVIGATTIWSIEEEKGIVSWDDALP